MSYGGSCGSCGGGGFAGGFALLIVLFIPLDAVVGVAATATKRRKGTH